MERAIDYLTAGNAQEFQKHVNDLLMNKLADRLELEKMTVASKLFGSENSKTEPSEDGEQE